MKFEQRKKAVEIIFSTAFLAQKSRH